MADKKIYKLTVIDHSDEAIEELNKKVDQWLKAIGLDAASTTAEYIEKIHLVDTGNLKNSFSGKQASQVDKKNKVVYVGTAVKYAPYQEYGTSKGIKPKHFLKTGVELHKDEYISLLEDILKAD